MLLISCDTNFENFTEVITVVYIVVFVSFFSTDFVKV